MARTRNSNKHKRAEKGFGSIREKEVKRKDGTAYTSYEYRYSLGKDDNGNEQRKSESFRTLEDAKKRRCIVALALQKAKCEHWSRAELEAALYPEIIHDRETFTVDEWFDRWVTAYMPGTESTREKYRGDYYRYISPRIGKKNITEVLPIDIQDMVNAWQDPRFAIKKPLSKKYVSDLHSMLKTCFKMAIENKKITNLIENPCKSTRYEKESKAEKKMKKFRISWNQLEQLIQVLNTAPHSRFYKFSAFFGLRVMENLGLTIDDIDFEKHVIHLRFQLRRHFDEVPNIRDGESKHYKCLKDKVPRDIYFDDVIEVLLKEQIDDERRKKRRLGDRWPTEELERGDLLFSNDEGYYLSYSTIRDCFGRRAKSIVPNISIHDLRHIYVLIAYASGVPTEIIAEHVGHEEAKLTEDVYLDIPEEMLFKNASAVGNTIKGIQRANLIQKCATAVGETIIQLQKDNT